MTKDDIIKMAQEAGFTNPEKLTTKDELLSGILADFWANLERFAALVAAHEREIFCSALRLLHDSYSLPSDPSTIRARDKHD